MRKFPYGGVVENLESLSQNANEKAEEKHKRLMSLELDDILDDLFEAFNELSRSSNIKTARKHIKVLSLLLIFISVIGLSLYYLK
jgi:hypothetical protein